MRTLVFIICLAVISFALYQRIEFGKADDLFVLISIPSMLYLVVYSGQIPYILKRKFIKL